MKLLCASLALAAATLGPAADVFTIVTWNYLHVYGAGNTNPTEYQPVDTLPTGFGVTVENNEGVLSVVGSAFRRRSQAGVTTKNNVGKAEFLLNILTDKDPVTKFVLRTRHTGSASATADVIQGGASAYARGSTTFPPLTTREAKAHEWHQYDEDSKGPSTMERNHTVTAGEWIELGGGVRETNIGLPTGMCTGRGVATSPGGGPNSIGASATGVGAERVKAIGLKATGGAGNYAGFVAGTRESFVASLVVEVRNTYNALIDTQMVSGDTSEWYLPFTHADGDYRLFFTAPGSLRKRVDISFAASTGVGGLAVTLYYGDLDGSNVITQAEVDAIQNNVGKSVYSASWLEEVAGVGCRIADCDLNQDLQITAADYLLAVGNVNRAGD